MDAYLINNGRGFVILYNQSLTSEAETEKAAEEGAVRRLAKNLPFYNLLMYATKWTQNALQSSNGKLLVAAADCGSFTVHYADTILEEQAKTAFERIAVREARKLSMAAAVNAVLIPVSYLPPLIILPMTAPVFGIAAYHSIKLRRAVKRGAKNARFRPNKEISELERKILDSGKNAEEWFSLHNAYKPRQNNHP